MFSTLLPKHQVLDFCNQLGEATRIHNFCHDVLPCVQQLVTDKWEHVRASLANVIMGLSKIVGKDL